MDETEEEEKLLESMPLWMFKDGYFVLNRNGNQVPMPQGLTPEERLDLWSLGLVPTKKLGKIVEQRKIGRYWVSTIALMLDYHCIPYPGETGKLPQALIWETMVFDRGVVEIHEMPGGWKYKHNPDLLQIRCGGPRSNARRMHSHVCRQVQKARKLKQPPFA